MTNTNGILIIVVVVVVVLMRIITSNIINDTMKYDRWQLYGTLDRSEGIYSCATRAKLRPHLTNISEHTQYLSTILTRE